MSIKLVDISSYVPPVELQEVKEEDFTYVVAMLRNPEENASDIETISPEDFLSRYNNYKHSYGMYILHTDAQTKGFRAKLSDYIFKAFRCSRISELNHDFAHNLGLSEDSMLEGLHVSLDDDAYQQAKSKSQNIKAELKAKFLDDMFADSGLADNEHNRLIAEKAWVVTCNTDYHGEYMSESFYYKVEQWFRELKDLAIN